MKKKMQLNTISKLNNPKPIHELPSWEQSQLVSSQLGDTTPQQASRRLGI